MSENIEDVCTPLAWEGEQPVAISGHSCAYATESIIPRHLAYLATAQDFQISKRKAAKGAAEGRRYPRPLRHPNEIAHRRYPHRDRGATSAIRILRRPPTRLPAQGRRHAQHVLDLGHRLDVGVDVERDHGVSLHAERLYKPPWRATTHALPKNMRKIERRLSTPNRSNGSRKSAGKLTDFAGR